MVGSINEKNVIQIKLIESWAIRDNPINSTSEILEWITQKNQTTKVTVKKIPYDYSGYWYYDKLEGCIRNNNNSFFQIKGIREYDNNSIVCEQPIIIQEEIGYLGIIVKEIGGILYFLMQAKIEPGNVNKIQISPTIQATKSNFMQSHGGRCPAYLEYFENKEKYKVIVDQIQSEQSSRFFGKRNRNMIILVEEEIEVLESHRWMTLGQIKELMHYDNLINMDTRTVISCIPFALRDYTIEQLEYIQKFFKDKCLFNSIFYGEVSSNITKIYQYINDTKMFDKRKKELVDLRNLNQWEWNNHEISSSNGEFKIIYCDIEIEGREVSRWQQPLLEAKGQSIFVLMYRIKNEKKEFLVKVRQEIGCFDEAEIGPSIQINANGNKEDDEVTSLFYEKLKEDNACIKFDGLFSEEGGRFYQEQNRNIIIETKEDELLSTLPRGYFWLDYKTLNVLIQFNNCVNIQLRNLLSIFDI